jgi:hypothetical protein
LASPAEIEAGELTSGRIVKTGLGVVVLALLLSACAVDQPSLKRIPRSADDQQDQTARAAENGAPAQQQAGQPAALADSPESLTEPVEGESASAVPGDAPVLEQEVASREIDLENFKERLAGLEADEVSELLGPPSFERSEPPAKIWQYRAEKCVVDVFLYDDGDLTVDFVEVRGRDNAEVDEKACFASVLENPPGQAAGEGGSPVPPPPVGATEPEQAVPGGDELPALTEPVPAVPGGDEPPALTEPVPEVPTAPDRDAPAQDFDTEKDPDIFGDN